MQPNARYPFVDLKHYYSPRQGILNKTVSEYRGKANITDVVMTDVSYGTILIKEGVSHPYTTPDVERYVRGSYDPKGHRYTMYMLTTALVYNRNLVKPGEALKTYQDLLDPKWKGRVMFDPEAAFIMAAMEEVWGKEKARDYLARLAKQDLIFRRGTTLTSQLVAAGEHPIACERPMKRHIRVVALARFASAYYSNRSLLSYLSPPSICDFFDQPLITPV